MQIYAQMRETKKFYRPGSKRSKEFILARTMMALVLVFLVLLTNKMDETVKISYFAAASPLFLTFFTLIITSFGSRGKLDTKLQ